MIAADLIREIAAWSEMRRSAGLFSILAALGLWVRHDSLKLHEKASCGAPKQHR